MGWYFVQGFLLNFYIIHSLRKLVLKLNKSEESLCNIRSINTTNQVFKKRQNTVKRTQCVVILWWCSYIDVDRQSEKQIKFLKIRSFWAHFRTTANHDKSLELETQFMHNAILGTEAI